MPQQHVLVRWSEIHLTRLHSFAINRNHDGHRTDAIEPSGESFDETLRHVLHDQH